VSTNDGPGDVPPEQAAESTSVFKPFLSEQDGAAQDSATESPTSESASSGVDSLPAGAALLVVKRGPNAGSRFLLDRETTNAGRHPDSDIFLDDVTVSRRHAEFRREGNDFVVVDVGSLNGTYVNREPVDTSVLANGDEVQIGKFRLVFLSGPGDGGQPAR
jgi:pSer/pThr/pTyr-binding forkhead associated (FHA) protein